LQGCGHYFQVNIPFVIGGAIGSEAGFIVHRGKSDDDTNIVAITHNSGIWYASVVAG